jgi:hypothetical protein
MTLTMSPLVQRAEALQEQELALLVHAVGYHLPYELVLRVDALRAQRAALESADAAPALAWRLPAC